MCDACGNSLEGCAVHELTWWQKHFKFCSRRCKTIFHMRLLADCNIKNAGG
jgi:hypothetical protein